MEEQNRSLFCCDYGNQYRARLTGHACWPCRPCGAPFGQGCDQNIGFVSLDNALEIREVLVLCAQKPMSPTKRGPQNRSALERVERFRQYGYRNMVKKFGFPRHETLFWVSLYSLPYPVC